MSEKTPIAELLDALDQHQVSHSDDNTVRLRAAAEVCRRGGIDPIAVREIRSIAHGFLMWSHGDRLDS